MGPDPVEAHEGSLPQRGAAPGVRGEPDGYPQNQDDGVYPLAGPGVIGANEGIGMAPAVLGATRMLEGAVDDAPEATRDRMGKAGSTNLTKTPCTLYSAW